MKKEMPISLENNMIKISCEIREMKVMTQL